MFKDTIIPIWFDNGTPAVLEKILVIFGVILSAFGLGHKGVKAVISKTAVMIVLLALISGCNKKMQNDSFIDIASNYTEKKEVKNSNESSVYNTVIKDIPIREPINTNIYFEFDRSDIQSREDFKILDIIVIECKAQMIDKLYVTGYACPIGTDEYNYELGLKRARSVANYLMKKYDIEYVLNSFGENKLVSTDPRFYHLNRYVNITSK